MPYSQFVTHYLANRAHMPRAVAESIRRDALARLKERWLDGPAFTPLDFADLIERIESAVAPH